MFNVVRVLLAVALLSAPTLGKAPEKEKKVETKRVSALFDPGQDGNRISVRFEVPKTMKIVRGTAIAKFLWKHSTGKVTDIFLFKVDSEEGKTFAGQKDLEIAYQIAKSYPQSNPFEAEKLKALNFEPMEFEEYLSDIYVATTPSKPGDEIKSHAIAMIERTPKWAILAYVRHYVPPPKLENSSSQEQLKQLREYIRGFVPDFEVHEEVPKKKK